MICSLCPDYFCIEVRQLFSPMVEPSSTADAVKYRRPGRCPCGLAEGLGVFVGVILATPPYLIGMLAMALSHLVQLPVSDIDENFKG